MPLLSDAVFAIARTFRTGILTVKFLARFALAFSGRRGERPTILRKYLESCGAGFVKVGQILAMRYDLLPMQYCQELAQLLNQVPPMEFSRFDRSLADGFGQPLSSVFASIEHDCMGSASIAQVHGATLLSGAQVAVKVMRPHIKRQFRIDLNNMRRLARLVDSSGLFGPSKIVLLAEELNRIVLGELNFVREARVMYLIHQNMEKDDVAHRSPAVYLDLCTSTVIVMERLDGIPMTELLRAIQQHDDAALATYSSKGIDRSRLARTLVESMFEQAFVHRLMHADPHAGNLIVLEGGILGFVDFGIVAHLDDQLFTRQRALFQAMARESVHEAYEAILDTFSPLPEIDLSRMESEIKDLVWMWIVAVRTHSGSIADLSTGRLILEVANVARGHGLHLPWRFLVFHRSTLMSDTILLSLDPDVDSVKILRDGFERETLRRQLKAVSPLGIVKAVNAAAAITAELPPLALEAMEWFRLGWPGLRREYSEKFSRLEMGILRGLRDVRLLCYTLAGIIAVGRLLASRWTVPLSLDQHIFLDWWWAGFVGSILCGALVSRAAVAMRKS
jgi:ubiquinone biosynthesis protein